MSAVLSSRVLSSWFIGGRLRPALRTAVMAVAAALTVTVAAVEPAAGAVPAAATPKVEKVTSRSDVVSARVTARAQGSRVEVESLRDETSTTWVNPDGTMTTQAHGGQIRFKDTKGAWRDVDLTLAEAADGTVAPKGHPQGLSLAGARVPDLLRDRPTRQAERRRQREPDRGRERACLRTRRARADQPAVAGLVGHPRRPRTGQVRAHRPVRRVRR